jgi:glycolate oxidase FAD binding subunit
MCWAAEGQRLPVDVPAPADATLGGALAVNLSGPRRLGRGTFRDYVIGIGFLSDDGVEVSGGGRVVKNVAGYDLMKLHVGAVGTLGVVTRVTLKVTPKPEDQALVAFGLTGASVGPTLDRLAASNSRPAALELLNGPAGRAVAAAAGVGLPASDQWVIVAGFEEKAATVAWQVTTLMDELKSAPVRDVTEFRGASCDPLWAALTDLQNHPPARLTWKATVSPSRLARFATDATADPDAVIHAHAGSGVAFGHHPGGELTAERTSAVLTGLAARADDGSVTVRRCPPEWKRSLPVWGRAAADRVVMRAIKHSLDPNNVFNPGRLFGDV